VDAFLNVMRVEELLRGGITRLLKQHRLSPPQYNVLRILRGAAPEGLRCQQISARMITRVPDITRLLDRLVEAGFVRRRKSAHDRRIVVTTLSKSGLGVLATLDDPVLELHRQQMKGLSKPELDTLNRLLCKLLEAGKS